MYEVFCKSKQTETSNSDDNVKGVSDVCLITYDHLLIYVNAYIRNTRMH